MSDHWKKTVMTIWRGWGISLLAALLIGTSFKSAIADWNDIPSGSMQPTILIGDRILVNKLAYDLKVPYTTRHLAKWADPQRGDIVVFYSPADGKRLIKRVVGMPGDRLAMYRNRLIINGQAVDQKFLPPEGANAECGRTCSDHLFFKEDFEGRHHTVMVTPSRPSLKHFGPVTIPPNHYFMMGDNRDDSADSRFFGYVERTQIVGRADKVVFSRDGSLLNLRWGRFWSDLS